MEHDAAVGAGIERNRWAEGTPREGPGDRENTVADGLRLQPSEWHAPEQEIVGIGGLRFPRPRISRRPTLNDARMVGAERASVLSPPQATAPAPM